MVGDHFERYQVETISLVDLKQSVFGDEVVNYLCIDTQGHEKSIVCSATNEYLNKRFLIIDVELMTDTSQYSIPKNNWKEVVLHLLRSGFEPLIHPHGITESYVFMNSSIKPSYFTSHLSLLRDRLAQRFFESTGLNATGVNPFLSRHLATICFSHSLMLAVQYMRLNYKTLEKNLSRCI